MPQLRYLTPFAFLLFVPLGGWLGGAWTFLAALATPLCLTGLDEVLGPDDGFSGSALAGTSRWLPRAYVVLQLAVTGWVAVLVAQPETSLIEAVGLAFSLGVTTGVFGFVAAHELIHSRNPRDRALGVTQLASVFYMHFRIAHVYGHHRRAATFEDPASARLGESLYGFWVRSVVGQFREAWAFERRRRGFNRMIAYVGIEVAFAVALALWNVRALVFVVAIAVVAIALLESFNYVAHYGLTRATGLDGRPERLEARHSWNSGRRMNNAALFNMGRHSDHHRRTTRPYEELEPLAGAAELPSGYAAALLTALIPPLWRRMMDPRARAVMTK